MKPVRVIGAAVLAFCLGAIDPASASDPNPGVVKARIPERLSLDISERPLREVLEAIEAASGVALQPMWKDESHKDGLDPDMPIAIKADRESVTVILERLLALIDPDPESGPTWQKSSAGSVQIGPRGRLNMFKRTEVYDVADLLRIVPSHTDSPTIDLQQALQGSGTPITNTDRGNEWLERMPSTAERAEELVAIIQKFVEPEQWESNGGDGGTMILHNKTLIVRAPGYIHRALHGSRG